MIGINPFNIVGKMGAMRGAASSALWGGIKGAARLTGNPFAHRTMIGAAAGAAWGGMSDDTSIVGGALMGAGLARYGGAAVRGGMSTFARTRGHLMGFRSGYSALEGLGAAGRRMARDGAAAGRFIATSSMKVNNGYNKFRGLFR